MGISFDGKTLCYKVKEMRCCVMTIIRPFTAATIVSMLVLCIPGMAQSSFSASAIIKSARAAHDVPLTLDPGSAFWRHALPISIDSDNYGRPSGQVQTVVRSRWTNDSLYLLFVCPYQELNLKPAPETQSETNELWNWDVAEAFIGYDFEHIRSYKEFEVSPQGEWIDLAIDLENPQDGEGWHWNSGFETAAHIDHEKKVWYGAMRIPLAAINPKPPRIGSEFRVNFFRCEGVEPERQLLAWQAPMGPSFHVPERFGKMKLVK